MALSAALTVGALLAATTSAADPYEPNDSIPSAAGPLAIDQTYQGALETSGDRDFFYFYVTSPQAAQVKLQLANLGGGTYVSDVDATLVDSTATPVGGISFVGQGETRSTTFTLTPQKYFIEIAAKEGFGDSYVMVTGGESGAFGDYGKIAARCTAASASVRALRAGLSREKTKLQRATSRVRRSRFSGQEAREIASSLYRRAKVRLANKRTTLKAALEMQSPWCFISK